MQNHHSSSLIWSYLFFDGLGCTRITANPAEAGREHGIARKGYHLAASHHSHTGFNNPSLSFNRNTYL